DHDDRQSDDAATETADARGIDVVEFEDPVNAVDVDGVELELEHAEVERQAEPKKEAGTQKRQGDAFEEDVTANIRAHELQRMLDAPLRFLMVKRFRLSDSSHRFPLAFSEPEA